MPLSCQIRPALVATAWLALALLPRASDAQRAPIDDLTERASAHVSAAMEAQADGRYDDAVRGFEAAYALVPHPVLIFDIGLALHLGGRDEEALAALQTHLGFDEQSSKAVEARALIRSIEESGSATIQDTSADPKVARQGTVVRAPADDVALVDTDKPDPKPTWTTRRRIAVAVGTSGLVSIGLGAGFALRATHRSDDAFALCGVDAMCNTVAESARFEALESEAHRSRLTALTLAGLGTAAVITGVVLFFTGRGGDDGDTGLAVTPTFNSTAAALSLSGTF